METKDFSKKFWWYTQKCISTEQNWHFQIINKIPAEEVSVLLGYLLQFVLPLERDRIYTLKATTQPEDKTIVLASFFLPK